MERPEDSDGWIRSFVRASRFDLSKNPYIDFVRRSSESFRKLNLGKVYVLDADRIRSILALCPSSYFVDQTGAYDDPADVLISSNSPDRLSNAMLGLLNGPITKAKFEEPLPGLDVSLKTEIAALAEPSSNIPADPFTLTAVREMGFEGRAATFTQYLMFLDDCRRLRDMLLETGMFTPDLRTVHELLLHVYKEM